MSPAFAFGLKSLACRTFRHALLFVAFALTGSVGRAEDVPKLPYENVPVSNCGDLLEGVDSSELPTGPAMQRGRFLYSDELPSRLTYAGLIGPLLLEYLESLGPDDQIVDVGSGYGRAIFQWIRDSHVSKGRVPPTVVVERDPPPYYFHREVELRNRNLLSRHRLIGGRNYLEIPSSEIGLSGAVMDVFGPFAYSDQPMEVLRKHLEILKAGGRVFVYSGVSTSFLNERGQKINPRALFDRVSGARVIVATQKFFILERTGRPVDVPPTLTIVTEERTLPRREIRLLNPPRPN